METKTHLLLVEDDELIASGLVYAFESEGYSVAHFATVKDSSAAINQASFDIAILDLQLPDGNGFDVREKLRASGASVIFLTVVDDEGNIVKALEGGADDYITKPFRLRELTARVKAALKRRSGNLNDTLCLGGVIINPGVGKAYISDIPLDLTALEYRLLLTFASNKGLTLSRRQILENIWDASGNFVEDNTLTVYVRRLREKLGKAANIETIRGMGYKADDYQ
jgi:DNA-binding response OmpR family regulator